MGNYLNSMIPMKNYEKEYRSPYFVDKSRMLEDLIGRVQTNANNICVTRPRRFGKSVMANMIAAFFGGSMREKSSAECDRADLFDSLAIAKNPEYPAYRGKYNVIFISFNELPRRCASYEQYIGRIENRLLSDLTAEYPDAGIDADDTVWDALNAVFNAYDEKQFIFVFDEWDFIFHRDFVSERDKKEYIGFLNNLLKDKGYVALAYMTGILPIAKYSSGSELNMFVEYTMAAQEKYSDCFGFTESEVDELYARYLKNQRNVRITREGLRLWYDGYQTPSGERMYNPRSVVCALCDNQLNSYWTSSGPYDEIYYYISHNVAAVRDDLALLAAGIPVPAKVREYSAVSMNLTTKDEIFSAMVVYGFLSYENGYVSVPNKELMDQFSEMLRKELSLGYLYTLSQRSSEMLRATLRDDEGRVAELMKYAHDTEIPLLSYNSESEMTVLVSLMYLSARDFYRVEREDKAGIGYADFIFYPEIDPGADGIILELKADHSAEAALQQIRDREYALKFEGKQGEPIKYTGRILGVGIAYDRTTKVHSCRIEVLRERVRTA